MNRNQYNANTSFLDLLFNALLGFVALFFLAFMLVNPSKKEDAKVVAKAEFIITVVWPKERDDDVDTYVQDPLGSLIMFRRREDGLMHLDRDDLGQRSDTVHTAFGPVVQKDNREIATIRGIIPGEYIVNAHMYCKNVCEKFNTGGEIIKDATPVTITIEKINPYQVVAIKTIMLEKSGDEKTACRFVIDKDGKVESVNELEKLLAVPELNQEQYIPNIEPTPEAGIFPGN